jgi:hypothetical protein
MAHDSRILIADLMFPSDTISPDDLSIATFDITMFNMGGKERSEADFRMLLENVGCELVKVWRNEIGYGVIVEGRLKGSGERVVDGPVEAKGEAVVAEGGATETSPAAASGEATTAVQIPQNGNDTILTEAAVDRVKSVETGAATDVDAPLGNGTNGAAGADANGHPNGVTPKEGTAATATDSPEASNGADVAGPSS